MKLFWTALTILFLLALPTERAEAVTYPQDASGTPMQRFDSRMPDSPVADFPGLLGSSYWPYLSSPIRPLSPPVTIMNVLIEAPEASLPPVQSKAPGSAKFWTARCGTYVQVDMDSVRDMTEEEGKPCTQEQQPDSPPPPHAKSTPD